MSISRYSRARVRPSGSRREVFYWYLMRLTGLGLFVLALAHFSILHFIWDPAEQTAEFVMNERWNRLFWRGFDWLLLMMVLFHGFIGMRTVVLDYIRAPRWRTLVLWLLYAVAVILFVIGTQVIVTLPMSGAE